jgi:TonB-linked SusC/RagA family outer membrane protein
MQKTAYGRSCTAMAPALRQGSRFTKTVLVMKLTILLLTAAILNVHAKTYAQHITFAGKNVELRQVFSVIEAQTGYLAAGSQDMLTKARPVTVDVKNMPLETLLELILKEQAIGYKISGKTILLFQKKDLTLPAGRSTAPPANVLPPIIPPLLVKGIVTGMQGIPLAGASVAVEGTKGVVLTDKEGRFSLEAEKGQTLSITYVGYQSVRWKVTEEEVKIEMKPSDKSMEDVEVVINTGYQKIKANEMVGSVEVVTEKMLQKQVSTNILQRLRGLTTALMFENKTTTSSASGSPRSVLNMTIRGWSTINGPTDPLIIVDNFPYQGDINNIDPNDVESIVLLKDAAATSIWGARAGNGVIVVNTRRGKFNTKTAINFRSTISITEKPDLYKLPLMSTPSYIDLEIEDAKTNPSMPIISISPRTPVYEILGDRYHGLISAEDSAAKIDYLKSIDSRQQWDKYIYRHALTQQYAFNVSGGSNTISWTLSGNFNKSVGKAQEKSDRATLSFINTFKISRKLEMELGIMYTNSNSRSGAPEFNSIKASNGSGEVVFPYLQLRDEQGNIVPMQKKFSRATADTVGEGLLLDYNYYPMTDWKHDYSTRKLNSYVLNGRLSYRPINDLQLTMSFQSLRQMQVTNQTRDKESYFTRMMVNTFSQINRATKVVTRILPLGDIVSLRNVNTNSLDVRTQATYNKKLGRHQFNLMVGMDISEYTNRGDGQVLVGYSDDPLTHTIVDMTTPYEMFMEFPASIGSQLGIESIYGINFLNERLVSTLASASYIYNDKLVFYGSLRRDGANMLGVNINDRWKPLWSAGFNWMINKEKFFRVKWISTLRLSSNIGISGNVDVTKTSKPVGTVSPGVANSANPFPYLSINAPPNPNLRWEKTRQINWTLNMGLLKDRISLNLEYYIKQSRDLYGSILADYTQSPATMVKANASSMDGSGYDVRITTKNLRGVFNWNTVINFSKNTSKIKYNYNQFSFGSASLTQAAGTDGLTLYEGTPLFTDQALFSLSAVRSAGLTNTGMWQFLVDGKPTTDINKVINDFNTNGNNASSYIYYGQSTPKLFGSINNEFSWKQFSLFVMMQYKFGYYFKKATYNGYFRNTGSYHKDWELRWRKPGDELITTVPGATVLNQIYYAMYSSDLVRKGDHIRIQNIQFNYAVPLKNTKTLKSLVFSLTADNVGIIWRANKDHLDPEYESSTSSYLNYDRPDRIWSFTMAAGL